MRVNGGNKNSKEAKKSYLSKVCYVFLGLSIALHLSWYSYFGQIKATNNPDPNLPFTYFQPWIQKTTLPVRCGHWLEMGIGYCDDEANIAKCGHDLNNCYQVENDKSLYQNCSCILSSSKRQVIKDENRGGLNTFLGDCICDPVYNKAENFFDQSGSEVSTKNNTH